MGTFKLGEDHSYISAVKENIKTKNDQSCQENNQSATKYEEEGC